MSDKTNGGKSKRPTLSDWKRPGGPVNVWRIIECEERLADGTSRQVRLSIQDLPEDRHEEAIAQMLKYFVAEEVTCKSLKLQDDKDAYDDLRRIWEYCLSKNMSIGAFKLDSDDKLQELVALNILFLVTEELENSLERFVKSFKSSGARLLFNFMNAQSDKADIRDIYGIDTYLSALGLSVLPAYRGQKLGVLLLETRTDICRKYNLPATETIFTGPASQIQAERAGFETLLAVDYDDVKHENGEVYFPNVQAKQMKLMMKRFL